MRAATPMLCIAYAIATAIPALAAAQDTQAAQTGSPSQAGFLPPAALFAPLLADPFEPRLGVALRGGRFAIGSTIEGVASFGGAVPLIGWGQREGGTGVQIGVGGGVSAAFDMETLANDLVSEDYEIGFPVWFRHGAVSGRLRVFHRSAHVGDEFLAHNPGTVRYDLSYESIELLVGYPIRNARAYAGWDYVYHSETTVIEPGALHGGADFRSRSRPIARRAVAARWVGGVDLQAVRDLDWRVATSVKAGLELVNPRAGRPSPTAAILVEWFSGPSSAGQFYGTSERYFGIAVYISP